MIRNQVTHLEDYLRVRTKNLIARTKIRAPQRLSVIRTRVEVEIHSDKSQAGRSDGALAPARQACLIYVFANFAEGVCGENI